MSYGTARRGKLADLRALERQRYLEKLAAYRKIEWVVVQQDYTTGGLEFVCLACNAIWHTLGTPEADLLYKLRHRPGCLAKLARLANNAERAL